MARICILPRVSGVGGMVSFRQRFSSRLDAHGVALSDDLTDPRLDAILVIGGTRRLLDLQRARRRGVRIVQRLNGMNWLHRMTRQTGGGFNIRHYLRAEYGNWLLAVIRKRLAHAIIYQSSFSRDWWERVHGPTSVENATVFNGVDLAGYSPYGAHHRPEDRFRLLLVEGSLMGGYEQGLEIAARLAEGLAVRTQGSGKSVELRIIGRVQAPMQQSWEERTADSRRLNGWSLSWAGLLPQERIPEEDRSAHLLYSSDINAACPNAVIEALACGLPVVALDTGALPEMVAGEAGRVVPYGGDPWRLDPPDVNGLVGAAFEVLMHQERFRRGARCRAEEVFSLERMTEGYLRVLLGEIPHNASLEQVG